MAITVEVKPDFSAFRTPTVEDIVAATGCLPAVAELLLENFTILPR